MGGRRIARGEAPGQERPATLRSSGDNLPVQTTPLLGRDAELAALSPMLLRADVSLLTLTGTGGIGKTRLALRSARLMIDDFSDGVFLVSLAPVRDHRLVATTIGSVLGIREETRELPLVRLARHLGSRQILLVLDNFEHLLPAATDVAALLAACPHLKVLVTSRAPLRITGEHECPVAPLGLPPQEHDATSLDGLQEFAALKLFCQRAQAVQPSFRLTAQNAGTVVEICRKLDGLPLAIELAAARSKLFPPKALLERLERRLEFLTWGARDLPARQQALRTTIDWSHDLLSETQRRLFRRLAVFSTDVEMGAVETVCGGLGDLPSLLDDLSQLVDHSLVRLADPDNPTVCIEMLETIREYALEKLVASHEEEQVREAHARFCLSWAEELQSRQDVPDVAERSRRLNMELSDFRAALGWALRTNKAELSLRLAGVLAGVWENNAHLREGRAWLKETLALEVEGGNLAGVRARLCHHAALLATRQSDWEAATTLAQESVQLFRAVEDARGEAHALLTLALVATMQGHHARSIELHERLLPLFEELDDPEGMARALHNFGLVHRFEDPRQALALGQRSLELYRSCGQARGVAQALNLIGWARLNLGHPDEARGCFEQSLAESWRVQARWVAGYVLQGLADAVLRQGDARLAASLLAVSEQVFETVEAPVRQVRLEQHYRELLQRLHRALDDGSFRSAWERGQSLSVEQVIDALRRPSAVQAADPLQRNAAIAGLTPREAQVLDLVANGLSDRQIAQRLAISPSTASKHVANILGKTGARSRVVLARLALQGE